MSLNVYYNPLDIACKSNVGAIKEGENVRFNLFLLKTEKDKAWGSDVSVQAMQTPLEEDCITPTISATFILNRDNEPAQGYPMEKTPFGWTITTSLPKIGLYFYTFYIEGIGHVSCGDMQLGYISERPHGFLLTVTAKNYTTPQWFKGGTMYQIFPDRFCKIGTMPHIKGRVEREDWGGLPTYKPNEYGKVLNNDFFGGNFKGIQSKLPYLQKLGVTVVYLNPIFEAASNHRYDTANYLKIDEILGTEEDFSNLINEGKKYGISFILDGVFNHTGDDSVYFNKYGRYPSVGAYQSEKSPYYSWYSFSEHPNRYESWWGIDILPQVNEQSPEYQNFIFGKEGVLKKWLRFEIGGYRLDVADELPDFFLKNLRKSVKDSNPEAIIIGEVWEDASNKIAYSQRREYLQGYELDSVMNYPLKEAIIGYMLSGDARILLRCVRLLIDHYPKETVDCLMNVLGTHDTARILTVLGEVYCQNKDEMASERAYLSEKGKENAIKKLKMAAVLQYTMPGVPCVYYGDENGMEGHIDPFCRRCFDWKNTNTDLLEFYQTLGAIRKENKQIFKNAEFQEIALEGGLFVYERTNEYGSIYVFVNNSSKLFTLDLPSKYIELISNSVCENKMEITPYSYGILKVKNENE